MEEKLQLAHDFVSQLKLERVHTIGPPKHNTPRKIVCKFNLFTDREIVRKQRSLLYNTDYYLHKQSPPPRGCCEKEKVGSSIKRSQKRQ